MNAGAGHKVTRILDALIVTGGYHAALVCTEDGLLVSAAGDWEEGGEEYLAGFTSLFDTVVVRATRDLDFTAVDEVTLLDPVGHRMVIRPLAGLSEPRMFLVVRLPRRSTWRQNTNTACKRLLPLLEPMTAGGDDDGDA